MSLKAVFLGTSGSMPTQSRASSSTVVKRKGELIMFDCGEGTQRRMVEAKLGFRRSMKIFVSHLHGDHVLGIPGLLQTMTLLDRERRLDIFGPQGSIKYVKAFSETLGGPSFPVHIHEVESPGIIYESEEYMVKAIQADHDLPAFSYVLEEKLIPGRFHPDKALELEVPEGPLWKKLQSGKDVTLTDGRIVKWKKIVDPPRKGLKIAYSGDTRPNRLFGEASKGADLLIHEATFDNELSERAAEKGHTTAGQAAEIALQSSVRKLVLTHISSRYPDAEILLEQAREIFSETVLAYDLLEIEVFRE
jgi:ribonuclease Z